MARRIPLIALVSFALTMPACTRGGGRPRPSEYEIYSRCKEYVKAEETNSGAFIFPPVSEVSVRREGQAWGAYGRFEAQDAEKGYYWSTFQCELAYEEDGEWRPVRLYLSKRQFTKPLPGRAVRAEATEPSSREGEARFGYTEAERRKIYREVVRAEDRAQREAERRYPTPDPLSENYSTAAWEAAFQSQMDYVDKYAPEYKAEVAQEFGLTMSELEGIVIEGLQKRWPLPP